MIEENKMIFFVIEEKKIIFIVIATQYKAARRVQSREFWCFLLRMLAVGAEMSEEWELKLGPVRTGGYPPLPKTFIVYI
jgi:hypothetical protein